MYKSKFPALIGNSYSAEKFFFQHTDFQRSEASFKAFAEGLFGEGAYNSFTIDPLPNPSMLLNVWPIVQILFSESELITDISANGPM